jgi:hypothetical protein
MEIERDARAGRGHSLPVVSEGSVLNASIQKVEGLALLLLSLQSFRYGPRRRVNFDLILMTLCQQLTSEFNSEIAAVFRHGPQDRFCSLRNCAK